MKNFFILFILSFLYQAVSTAQVLEDSIVMSLGFKNALTIIIPETTSKFVDAEWKEYLKPYGKVTKIKQSIETITPDVQILDIGGISKLTIYNRNESVTEGVKANVWIAIDSGFVQSEAYPKEYVASVKWLKDFAFKVINDQITVELEAEQKILDKFSANLTKLQKENTSLHKSIEDSKEKITKAEADIETNLNQQEMAQKDIDNQKTIVGEIQKQSGVTSKQIDEEVKQLSKLESNLTKLKKSNDSLHKVISDSNTRITKAEEDIITNLENQELVQKEIDNQKVVVAGVQTKLDKASGNKPN